jgi:CRP-like cAMP-binding protein
MGDLSDGTLQAHLLSSNTSVTVRAPRRAARSPMVAIHPPRDGSLEMTGLRASASAVDHALTLLLADETEAALRWSAAILERAPLHATALIITSRLLDQMGRTRAAIDGLRLAVRRAIEAGDLPLAVVAIDDLRVLGADPREAIERVATAFGRGSARIQGDEPEPVADPPVDFLEPLSPFLAGPPLASRATQIVFAAKQAHDASLVGSEPTPLAPWPLFSALTKDALVDLLSVFHAKTVAAGHRLVEEGEEGDTAYVVVQGEVEISRRAAPGDHKPRLAVATLGPGAFFGEMSLLSRLPSATFATTTRATILLTGKRDALSALAARRPELAIQLAAHCRRNSLANLGWTSAVVAMIPHDERAALVERLQMRIFERGEKLMREREEAKGLHLVVSGEVAIVGREWSERVLLATLGPGETVGEVELVLCRQAYADAIAMRPTAALFLSKEEYTAIVQDRPSVLHGLYATAVRRNAETRLALDSGSAVIADDWLIEEEQTETHVLPTDERTHARVLPPRAHAASRVVVPPPLPVQPEPVPVPPAPATPSVSATAPPPVATKAGPSQSMAPTSTSIRPSLAPPRSSGVAPIYVATGGALLACAAGICAIFIARDAARPSRDEAVSAASRAVPTSTQSTITAESEATAEAHPVPPTATTWTPIPVPPPAASSAEATASTPAKLAARAPVRVVRPAPPAHPVAVAAAPPATASPPPPTSPPSTAASPPAATAPAPTVPAAPPVVAVSNAPPAATTASAPRADDFGGRE